MPSSRSTILLAIAAASVALAQAAPAQAATVGADAPGALRGHRVADQDLVRVLNELDLLVNRQLLAETGLAIRIFSVPHQRGSARDGESDRVVHDLYIAVSDFGEYTSQRVYRIGPVYAPRLESLVVQKRVPVAFVSYGSNAKRRSARLAATLDGVSIRDALGKP